MHYTEKLFVESELTMAQNNDLPTKAIAETENYIVWEVEEPDGEMTIHVELGTVTMHFFREEWTEFLALIKDASQNSK